MRHSLERNSEPLINRYEHNYFSGYVFATYRAGRSYVKYFSDRPHGKRDALMRARAYRDWLLPRLPPPTRTKRTNSANTTGVVGVSLSFERTRSGRVTSRYAAGWPVKGRRNGRATFSVEKYGEREARRLAIEARTQGLAKYLASVSHRDYRPKPRSKGRR